LSGPALNFFRNLVFLFLVNLRFFFKFLLFESAVVYAMPRRYTSFSNRGSRYVGRSRNYGGYIKKRRHTYQAGVHDRRMSALMAARGIPTPVVRGFVGAGAENKYHDVAAASYVLDNTGSITHLDVVPQGSTVNRRDGRKFSPLTAHFRGRITSNSATTFSEYSVILLWDKQPNKALAAVTDVLDAANPYAQNKRENASRFRIIRRWDGCVTGKNDGTSTSGFARNFDKFVRLPRGLIAECTPADITGEIGNRVTGALLLVTVGNQAAGNTAGVCYCSVRIGFQDV